MRKHLVVVLVASACLVCAGAASASMQRAQLRPLCQLAHVPAHVIRSLDALAGLCKDKRLLARPRAGSANVVYGNCGYSWLQDSKLGVGWIHEYVGVAIYGSYGGIRYGGATISWYNFSHTQYRGAENAAIYPGAWWDDVHNAYTHSGLIGSWLKAVVVTGSGYVCSNVGNEPHDYVRV